MKITHKSKFAFELSVAIAKGGTITTYALAELADRSTSCTEIVLRKLRVAGIVKGTKGPGGGYTLTKPADEISIAEIIKSVDGSSTVASSDHPEPWDILTKILKKSLDSLFLSEFVEV